MEGTMSEATHEAGYEAAHYLNVDLEIESTRPIDALAAYLSQRMIEMARFRRGRVWFVSFELTSLRARDADRAIRAFVQILDELPAAPRREWKAAGSRRFNIGLHGGFQPYSLEVHVGAPTIAAAATVGAGVSITVYRPHESPPQRSGSRKTKERSR